MRCDRCVWARWRPVAVSDGYETSEEMRTIPALFCHIERPRLRVDPDGFCPEWKRSDAVTG